MRSQTIFALSSGRPPAAISIIRLSGPDAHAAAGRIAGRLAAVRQSVVRELRHPGTGELIDVGLVLRFDAPASSTGEDVVEFHCHGGRAVVDALLDALRAVEGLREALPGEFTRRAFENGRIDLTEAEGLADLLEAETQSQRRAALASAEGGLRRQIDSWRERVLFLSAQAELAIDYDDEELVVGASLAKQCHELGRELKEWLARPRVEPLKEGVMVVVAGPPNSGKSSLINAIAGADKVIVSDMPGTTRDIVEVPLSLGGLPIRLTDTAGLRTTDDQVEALGVEKASRLIEAADVLLWLGEADQAPLHPRLILVHSKADLPERQVTPVGALPVSSLSNTGLDRLLKAIAFVARAVLPAEDAIALNRRQAGLLAEVQGALDGASSTVDLVLCAEDLRQARSALDRLTGRAGVEDLLDALFSRFCLGK